MIASAWQGAVPTFSPTCTHSTSIKPVPDYDQTPSHYSPHIYFVCYGHLIGVIISRASLIPPL